MKKFFIIKYILIFIVGIIILAFIISPRLVEHGIDYFMENYVGADAFNEISEREYTEHRSRDDDYAYDDYDREYDYDLSR